MSWESFWKKANHIGIPVVLSLLFLNRWSDDSLTAWAAENKIAASGQDAEIGQDSVGPEFSVFSIRNDGGYTARDDDGIYYFAKELSVELTITEVEVPEGEAVSDLIIFKNDEQIVRGPSLTSYTDTIFESGTYVYRLWDVVDDRFAAELTVVCQRSDVEPDIRGITFDPEPVNVDGMDYFHQDMDILASVTDELGVARIEYRETDADDSNYLVLLDNQNPDGNYPVGSNTSYTNESLIRGTLEEKLTDVEDGVYSYMFRVINVLGREREETVDFSVDRTMPESTVYVSYETDGTNEAENNDTGIMEFLKKAVDRIFGKTKITVHLYVKDGIPANGASVSSGIDMEDLAMQATALGGKVRTRSEIQSSTVSFTYDGIDHTDYAHLKITVTIPDSIPEGSFGDQIRIGRLKDRAGNVLNGMDSEDMTGSTVLYLDNVPPVLWVDYGDGIVEEENGDDRIFYKDTASLGLYLTESGYREQTDDQGKPIEPKIELFGDQKSSVNMTGWELTSNGAKNALLLPGSAAEETEYGIRIVYEDGAGNSLTREGAFGENEIDETGSDYTIVVDSRAPELTAFSIDGEKTYQVNGMDVYHNKGDGDAVISFAIDDNDDYWEPSAVSFKIVNQKTKEPVVEMTGEELENWTVHGRIHEISYRFRGEDNTEAGYQVQVSYTDRAGNLMADGRNMTVGGNFERETGVFISREFILDHLSPVLDIAYSEAHRLVSAEDGTDHPDGRRMPAVGYNAYYGRAEGQICVTMTIRETYAVREEDGELKDCTISLSGENDSTSFVRAGNWVHKGSVHQVTYIITGDGDYQIQVTYEDAAGNRVVRGTNDQNGNVTDGCYVSPVLILDTEVPIISVPTYSGTPVNTYDGRAYFDSSVNLILTVHDQHIRYGELKEVLGGMTAADSSGNSVMNTSAENFIEGIDGHRLHRSSDSEDSGAWTVSIPLRTEANYDIPVAFTDLAGNQAEYRDIIKSCVDISGPELKNLTRNVSASGFMDVVNYRNLGFLFADHKLTIRAETSDCTAGIQRIRFFVTDEDGQKTEWKKDFAPSPAGSYEITIPFKGPDFKGTVEAEVLDWSANESWESRGVIVESEEKHSSIGSAVITTKTSPSRTVGGVDFYNRDISFRLCLKDTYSGLRKWSYRGGSTLSDSMDYAKLAGRDVSRIPAESITYEYSADLTLDANENNHNDVKVSAEYTDHAGHTGSVEQIYHIDVTIPVITVEYDQKEPSNGRYYDQDRTATVTIQERNFNADDVEFKITNTEGAMPIIGNWSSSGLGDDRKHVCEVVFCEDGDYTFTVAFEDLAGNKAEYDRVDEFTIDQTEPVLRVSWDNDQSAHGHYYDQPRTATIDIIEHNFDPDLIHIHAVRKEAGEDVPTVSGWSRNGDQNTAMVTFYADGDYIFDISGMDLADNSIRDHETEHFVIDRTAPELEIFNVEHGSANRGAVMPGVRYSDKNFDADAMVILMKGYQNGIVEMSGKTSRIADGVEVQFEDFAHVPKMDDLYTMEVNVFDLAGNSSEASVVFSVNRFGSVYTFDDRTSELVGDKGNYYTDQEQDIVVIETNVDTLEFREITCNLDGELRTLTEGEDFTIDMSGSDLSWKQYIYTIDKKNFVEEGTYILTICSEDRAANVSDNNTKGRKIEFAVDKTSPSILISGVESDGRYREDEREVTIDIQDNIRLIKAEVTVDGEKTVYQASELSEGKIVLHIGSASHWQNMNVRAYDAAGNEAKSETLRFLITSDPFVQFYMNRMLFCGTIGFLILVTIGVWMTLIRIGHKRDKKETWDTL